MFAHGKDGLTGQLIAKMLTNIWRKESCFVEFTESDLARVTPPSLVSGAAGLGWWRIRETPLANTADGFNLLQAFRLQTLYTAQLEAEITDVFTLLREANIEPILIKGWSNSRLYPRTSLRPYGDIDLCVAPHHYTSAKAQITKRKGETRSFDVHSGFATIDRRPFDELYARSQLVTLNGVSVRVLGDEDQLRVLCLHLLRHGAWRPLWLCDVAAALESQVSDFDWGICLGDNRREANLVTCVIGLAHQLLGADIAKTPVAAAAENLPRWLVPSVLKSWNNPSRECHEPQRLAHTYLRNPRGLIEGMRRRWRTPVRATMNMGAPFSGFPRFPVQAADYLTNSIRFAAKTSREFFKQANASTE